MTQARPSPTGRVTVQQLLAGLVDAGLLTDRAVDLARQSLNERDADKHPIIRLARLGLPRADRQ